MSKWVFSTRRNGECLKCHNFEGNVYDNIQDGPKIPEDTHEGCTCSYVKLEKGKIIIKFVTRGDEKVCDKCLKLDSMVFHLDDRKPKIGTDTHQGCRCRYLIYRDTGKIVG